MIWTIYEMLRRTPKRKAARSNRAGRAKKPSHSFICVMAFDIFIQYRLFQNRDMNCLDFFVQQT